MDISECIKHLESLRKYCEMMFDDKWNSNGIWDEYITALDMALKILRSPDAYQMRPLTEDELKSMFEAIKRSPMTLMPAEPVSRWISVEEALPEDHSIQVLMTDGERCYISTRNNMVRFADCDGIFIPGKSGAGVPEDPAAARSWLPGVHGRLWKRLCFSHHAQPASH